MTFQPISEDILAAKGGQLRLWEHTVSAGYAPSLSHAGTYSHSAQVRYGFGPPAWRFDVGLDVGQQSYDTTQDSRTERWVGGQLRAGCHHCIGSMDVLAGLRGHYIQQRLERRDARLAAAAGHLAPTEYDGLGIGPTAALRWSTAFAAQWAGVLEGQSSLLVVKEGSEWALRPSTGIGLCLRWSSDMGGYLNSLTVSHFGSSGIETGVITGSFRSKFLPIRFRINAFTTAEDKSISLKRSIRPNGMPAPSN